LIIVRSESGCDVRCLVDTGADTPVFVDGEEELKSMFPSAEKIQDKYFRLSGFGKYEENVPVYRIPIFEIESDLFGIKSKLIFKDLIIACCDKTGFRVSMILSATLFSALNMFIYNIDVEQKQIEFKYKTNIFKCFTTNNSIHGELGKVYVLPWEV
jgi:hypothetical protein